MTKLFKNRRDFNSFKEHVGEAPPVIKAGIWCAYALKRLFGSRLDSVPILRMVDGSISALVAMHLDGGDLEKDAWVGPGTCRLHPHISEFQSVVVGSGPGGSVVARNESLNGRKVLLIEKGTVLNPAIPHHSPEQMKRFFESGGQELILAIPPIPFAQGSVLGGGSEINSGLYHRLPEFLRKQWIQFAESTESQWVSSERKVEEILKVSRQSVDSLGVYALSPIAALAKNLGWDFDLIPRWRTYGNQDFVHHGMSTTYLAEANDSGTVTLLGHEVVRIKSARERVEISIKGSSCSHIVTAETLCLAAGTVGTPQILWRSRLAKRRDFTFRFHAMIREVAQFDRDVNDLHDIDPYQAWSHEEGVKIGAAVSTPKLLEATLASKAIDEVGDYKKIGVYYASIASEGASGFLSLGRRLYPYFVPSKAMVQKIKATKTLLGEALESVGATILGRDATSISTVHIFGSIALGSNRLIDANGFLVASHGRIFIRDASLLPTHPTVNPQGPLLHLIDVLEEIRLNG